MSIACTHVLRLAKARNNWRSYMKTGITIPSLPYQAFLVPVISAGVIYSRMTIWGNMHALIRPEFTALPAVKKHALITMRHKTKRLASSCCNSCRRVFYGRSCLELHSSKAQDGKPSGPEKPSICQARRKCAHCRKLLVGRKEQGDHCCGWGEWPLCREQVDLNTHRCYIQKAKDPDEIREEKRAVQLAKRKKWRHQQGGDASVGLRTLRSNTEAENQEQSDEYKEPLLVILT